MENLAPPVVAVIVTCDPGPWFEETLRSFAAQDYPELSVLVLDAASATDPTSLVAEILPGAFVRRLEHNLGYAANVNEVLVMVQGASHLLLCHDDVALDPDVVHVMVEESLRSNAAIVTPKIVSWDDPTRLLHVGMAVDKGGAVVDRVDPLEMDHGQHDAVQDVFLAPGGCTLVRADLFTEMGGLSPAIVAMGEDLDLCWRAQVAGARVVVAPGARVRHLERLASGSGVLPAVSAVDVSVPAYDRAGQPVPRTARTHRRGGRITLQAMQRRHELRTVLAVYGPVHLLRVVPQLVVLSAAEVTIGLVTGNRDRARAVVHAWRWNWEHRVDLRAARAEVKAHRRLTDTEVRRLQLRGSARLTAYVRRAVTHGFSVAHAGAGAEVQALIEAAEDPEPIRPRRQLGRTGRITVWVGVGLVILVGSRQLTGGGLPYLGQFLPLPSWHELLHRYLSGWQPTGLGTTDPTSPATGVLGVAGFLLAGSTAMAFKLLVLACVPVGGLGLWRLIRPFGSAWARMIGTIAYLSMPVAYDAIARGRLDALLAYAAMPWILSRLAHASGLPPYGPGTPPTRRGWRSTTAGQILSFGVLEAALSSIAPALSALVLLSAVLLALAVAVVGSGRGTGASGRVLRLALGGTVVTAVLLAPWSISLLSGPARITALTGLTVPVGAGPTWGSLLRMAIGPIGDTPLAFGFVLAAGLPLVIGARRRLVWAGHVWILAAGCWVLAWAEGRGWLGSAGLDPHLLLAPAAVAMAVAVGLGAAAFERDLSEYRFGWRQVATVVAAGAALVAALPLVAAAGGGRWDLPLSGYGEATAWLAPRAPAGGFRVLWLADPRVMPGGGWQLGRGLSYSLSDGGLPDDTAMWPGSDPGAAAAVGRAIDAARAGDTANLGQTLAVYAVRYIIVVDSLAPTIPGYQSPFSAPPPAQLLTALSSQLGMRQVVAQGGFQAYTVTYSIPEIATRPGPRAPSSAAQLGTTTDGPGLTGWVPVVSAPGSATAISAPAAAGTTLVGRAPSGVWSMVGSNGWQYPRSSAFGYASQFRVAEPGTALIRYTGSWQHTLEVSGQIVLWVVALALSIGRRRWLEAVLRGVGLRQAHHGAHAPGSVSAGEYQP